MDLHRNLWLFDNKLGYIDRQNCDKSIFRSDVNARNFKTLKKSFSLAAKMIFSMFLITLDVITGKSSISGSSEILWNRYSYGFHRFSQNLGIKIKIPWINFTIRRFSTSPMSDQPRQNENNPGKLYILNRVKFYIKSIMIPNQ